MNERPQHVALGLQLHERELDPLIGGKRFAEGLALLRVGNRLVDTELRCSQRRGGLANAVLVEKVLHDLQPAALATEDAVVRYTDILERYRAMIRGHVESPEELLDLQAFRIHGCQECGYTVAVARLAAGTRHHHVVLGFVDPRVPGLRTIDHPFVTITVGVGFHVRRVGAVGGFGNAERKALAAFGEIVDPLRLLLLRPVLDH